MKDKILIKNRLVSLAMLKVQIDEDNQNYLDCFVPYFLQIIKQIDQTGTKKIKLADIRNSAKKKYGFSIPMGVIELIIKRINGRYPNVLNKTEHHEYSINNTNEIISSPDEKYSDTERGITAVCNALIEFSKDKLIQIKSVDEAFEAIEKFLSEFPIDVMRNIHSNRRLESLRNQNSKKIILIGLFIEYLSTHDSANYTNFSNLVKGYLLISALLCQSITNTKARVNTTFYIDTPVFLGLMGVNGEERETPIKELLELILKLGGKLCVFSHTMDEIRNVLHSLITAGNSNGHNRSHLSKSELLYIDEDLESQIENRKISIQKTPTALDGKYSESHQIDEAGLERKLRTEILYLGDNAPIYDAKSIVAIQLIRQGSENNKLEDAPSLLTSNLKLISVVDKFQKENSIRGRCSAISVFMATNLLWLKSPMDSPDLPMRTVIAQSYVLRDESGLWEKFLQKVENLQNKGDISARDIQILRGSEKIIENIILEKTLGDPKELEKDANISKIYEQAKGEIIQEEKAKTIAVNEKLRERDDVARNKSKKIAVFLSISTYFLMASLVMYSWQINLFDTESINIVIAILAASGLLKFKTVYKFFWKKILHYLYGI